MCERLAVLNKPEWKIPLPEPLPEDLTELQKNATLYADVWVTKAPVKEYAWLYSVDLRQGMRAALLDDRCQEERRRIGIEQDNMCRWFGRRLTAAHVALLLPESMYVETALFEFTDLGTDAKYRALLEHERQHLLDLTTSWITTSTRAQYMSYMTNAPRIALKIHSQITGSPSTVEVKWLNLVGTTSEFDNSGSKALPGKAAEHPERGLWHPDDSDSELDEDFVTSDTVFNPAQVILDDIDLETSTGSGVDTNDDIIVLPPWSATRFSILKLVRVPAHRE